MRICIMLLNHIQYNPRNASYKNYFCRYCYMRNDNILYKHEPTNPPQKNRPAFNFSAGQSTQAKTPPTDSVNRRGNGGPVPLRKKGGGIFSLGKNRIPLRTPAAFRR